MSKVEELRKRIANGDVKPNQGGQGGVGAGVFPCIVESAEYSKGQNGNPRGMLKMKVIGGDDPAKIGKFFNIYLQTQNANFMEQTIAEMGGYCAIWGIPEEKLYEEAETYEDIIQNICTRINRAVLKGARLLATIERKPQTNSDGTARTNAQNGKPFYWNNWTSVGMGMPGTPSSASVPEGSSVPKSSQTAGTGPSAKDQPQTPATTAPSPVSEASAPVSGGQTGKKKPWQK